MRDSNTFTSYTGQKWLILAPTDVLLAGSVSGCGSPGAENPRQEMQQETQESLSGAQGNSAGHTAGRTDGGEAGKEEEREKETKEKDTQEKETKDECGPYMWNRGYGSQVKLLAVYDYRTEGRAPQIGNQGSLRTCWAFISLAALESSLLPGQRMISTVDHMPMHNSFLLSQDGDGEYTVSMAYLLVWQGPVSESEDPYGDGYSLDGLMLRKHVQEIQVLKAKDYDVAKRAVYLEEGVQSLLYTSIRDYQSESVYYNWETNSYCYTGNEKSDHDSVIVGWDDNYSRENPNMDLEEDGAFICTNSWGEDFGDQGYFYVSYYDTNIGVHSIVYTGAEQVNNYDRIHQSDLCGWVGQIGYGQDEVWFSNVYRADSGKMLVVAGFYAMDSNTQYELYVARHLPEAGDPELEEVLNSRTLLARGKLANVGFYITPLEEKILLDDDEKFAIIVKIITPGIVHLVAIEYDAGDGIALVDLKDGEGYLSHDSNVWEHVEETQGCNICLKVYTKYK